MFVIKENKFEKEGVVIYKNEFNDTLRVTADKSGGKITIKFRPSNKDVHFEIIELKYPFKDEGLTFKPQFQEKDQEYIHSIQMQDALYEIISLVEKWIIIANDLAFLAVPAAQINPEISDKELEQLTYEILDELYLFDEIKDFVARYKFMLAKLNYHEKYKNKKH